MNALRISAVAVSLVIMASCASGKKSTVAQANSDEVEVTQLCHKLTDSENFYANAIAESSDMQMAKDKAINSARAEISATLSVVVESFTKRYRKDVNDSLEQKTEDRLELLVKQTLANSAVDCERVTRTNQGKYRAYVTVKLVKKEVADALEKAILEDKELKLNFDQSQFDKVADEAMKEAGLK